MSQARSQTSNSPGLRLKTPQRICRGVYACYLIHDVETGWASAFWGGSIKDLWVRPARYVAADAALVAPAEGPPAYAKQFNW